MTNIMCSLLSDYQGCFAIMFDCINHSKSSNVSLPLFATYTKPDMCCSEVTIDYPDEDPDKEDRRKDYLENYAAEEDYSYDY